MPDATSLKKQKPFRRLPEAADLMRRVEIGILKKYNLPKGTIVVNPLEFLLKLVAGQWPESILLAQVAGSKDDKKGMSVPLDVSLEAAKAALPYLYPKLAATEVTGKDGGPIRSETAYIDVAEMMKVPTLRAQVEDLQLEMARLKKPPALPAPGIVAAQEVFDTTAETVERVPAILEG